MKRGDIKRDHTYIGKSGIKRHVLNFWQAGAWMVTYVCMKAEPLKAGGTLSSSTLDNFAKWAVREEKPK